MGASDIHKIINERREQLILKLKRLVVLHKIIEMFLNTINELIDSEDTDNEEFIIGTRKAFQHVSFAVSLMGENVEDFIIKKLNFLPIQLPVEAKAESIIKAQLGDSSNVLAEKIVGLVESDGFTQLRKSIVKINVEQKELTLAFDQLLSKFKEVLKKKCKSKNAKEAVINQITTQINGMLTELYPKGGAPLIKELKKINSQELAEIFNVLAMALVQMLMQFKLFSEEVGRKLNKTSNLEEVFLFNVAKLLLEIDKKTAYFNNYAMRAKETMEEYARIKPAPDANKLAPMLDGLKTKISELEAQFEKVRAYLDKVSVGNVDTDLKLVFDEIIEVWAHKIEIDKRKREKIEPTAKLLDSKNIQSSEKISSMSGIDKVLDDRVTELLNILEPYIDGITELFTATKVKQADNMKYFKERLTHYAETQRFVGQLNPDVLLELYQARYLKRTQEFNEELDKLRAQAKQLLVNRHNANNSTDVSRYSVQLVSVPSITIPKKNNATAFSPRLASAEKVISNPSSPRSGNKSSEGALSPRESSVNSSTSNSPLAFLKRKASFLKQQASKKFDSMATSIVGHSKKSNSPESKTVDSLSAKQVSTENKQFATQASNTERFLQTLDEAKTVKQVNNNNVTKKTNRISRFVDSCVDYDFNESAKQNQNSKNIADSLTLDTVNKTTKSKINFTGNVAKTHEFWSKKAAESDGTSTAVTIRGRTASAPAPVAEIKKQDSVAIQTQAANNTNKQASPPKVPPKPLPKPSARKISMSVGHSDSPKISPRVPPKINNPSNVDTSTMSHTLANKPK